MRGFMHYIAIMMSLAALLALCVLRKPSQSLWMFLVPQLRMMSVPSHWFQRSQASLYRRKWISTHPSVSSDFERQVKVCFFHATYLLTCCQSIPGIKSKKTLSYLKLLLLKQLNTFVGSCLQNTSSGWIHRGHLQTLLSRHFLLYISLPFHGGQQRYHEELFLVWQPRLSLRYTCS